MSAQDYVLHCPNCNEIKRTVYVSNDNASVTLTCGRCGWSVTESTLAELEVAYNREMDNGVTCPKCGGTAYYSQAFGWRTLSCDACGYHTQKGGE